MKDIKGYKGSYAACEDGRIWAYPKLGYIKAGRWNEGRYLKPYVMKNGYHVVSLFKNGKQRKFLVHRLIAQTFIKNPSKFPEVNHRDMNKANCSVKNLEWCTRLQNRRHAAKNGVNNKGEKHGLSKLTNKQVIEIKKLYALGGTSYMKLAKRFNVSAMTISDVILGVTWRHIL